MILTTQPKGLIAVVALLVLSGAASASQDSQSPPAPRDSITISPAAAARMGSASSTEANTPPALSLSPEVAEAAAVYVAFIKEVTQIQAGGFQSAAAIQSSITRGSTYEPGQLSRGMIAYGAVLALQSPEFVASVRAVAANPEQRAAMIARINENPANAATFTGSTAAAGLISAVIGQDVATITALAEAIEGDAYTIQERNDPRRRWSALPVTNRDSRLEAIKTLSATPVTPSLEEAARLLDAAHGGSGLNIGENAAYTGPYTMALVQSLAIAALAALGASDEDPARTQALLVESEAEFCLGMSKLNLFQCLSAVRPSFEEMFCLGRHVVRDIAVCSSRVFPANPATAPTPASGDESGPQPVAAAAVAAASAAVGGRVGLAGSPRALR